MRFCGTFTLDGQLCGYNVDCPDADNIVNHLMNLYPGSVIAVLDSRLVEIYTLPQ